MSSALHTLYGTTNDSDSVPRALLLSLAPTGPCIPMTDGSS